jgi:phage-related minor tail protein
MAGAKIRGITIELGADTTGISKALGGLNSEISSTQKQLKDVEKLLKLDPSNTELLRQKQELLSKAVETSKEKVDALKQAQAELGERTEENAKQYDAIEREIISCEAEQKKWNDQLDAMTPKAKSIKDTLSEVSEATGKAAEKTKALSAAAAGAAAGLLGNAVNAARTADDINTLSKQYGVSVREIQRMNYAQDLIDVSTKDMLASYAKLTKQMGAGSDAFEKLGVNIYDVHGDLRDSQEVWYDTLEALSKVSNETERDVLAMDLFGKSAASLSGIIDDGGEALKTYGQEAEDAGLILSTDALESANQFNDAMDTLKARTSKAFLEAGAALADTLVPALESLVEAITGVLTWFANLDGTTQTVILTILALVAAISPLASIISAVATIIPVVTAAFAALSGPIGIVIAIIGALVAAGVALYQNWDTIKQKASELWGNLQTTFENIKKTISDKINDAKQAVMDAVEKIKGAFNFQWSLPKIKLPHFSVTEGKFGLPNISVQWYKKGYENGVLFNRPTVLPTASGFKGFGDGNGGELVIGMNRLKELIGASQGPVINVYTQPGMNETAVANAVALKLDKWLGERV